MIVKFWGVRGSIPVPGPDTVKYGGNTTCLEVRGNSGELLIIDAGSGIRVLGLDMMKRGFSEGNCAANILFTHTHWDHIQGFPFFLPAYVGPKPDVSSSRNHPVNTFNLYGAANVDNKIESTLRGQMDNSYFPVDLDYLPSNFTFNSIEKQVNIGNLKVSATKLRHPNGALGYKIQEGKRSFVFATDCEHPEDGSIDSNLLELSRNTNLLIYDGQYTKEEYDPHKSGNNIHGKQGYGHSTPDEGVRIVKAAMIEQLIITHHDPLRTDAQISVLEEKTQKLFKNTKFAFEGMEINI